MMLHYSFFSKPDGGKRLPGLVRRRKMEADLYFS